MSDTTLEKRIEGAAAAGEVLVSADVAAVLETGKFGLKRQIAVKGKEMPIEVYPLLD